MGDPTAYSEILWSSDPATRRMLWTCCGLTLALALLVVTPLALRAIRLFFLERRLRDTLDEFESKGAAAQRSALRELLRDSILRLPFEAFERRWTAAQITEGGGRAPIRLLDVLEDQPLLPVGPRRSLLAVLPGVLLGIWVLGVLFGVIPAAAGGAVHDPLTLQLGLALRGLAWGFASLIAASIAVSLVEGSFEARSRGLDEVLVQAYEAVSPGELAELTRQTQQKSLDILGRELTQFAHELNERMERGLQRIEQSSARAASLVSQEQRGALHSIVQELSLSVRQGVDHHLAELRGALQRAVDYQSSVTNGLSETYERMVENAQMQDRVARTLADSAAALDSASRSLGARTSAEAAFLPSAIRPAEAGAHAERPREGDGVAARVAEELGVALRGFTQQVQQIDETLDALRKDLHEDGRSRKATSGEAAARSTRPGPLAPRERSWAAAPDPRPLAERPSAPAAPPAAPAQPAARRSDERPPQSGPDPERPAERAPDRGADLVSVDGPIGRELSLSGFRVGAPRAQGPDPYERFASGNEPPSNVRHFPTRERELGDELKLSGLLGPSAPPAADPAPTRPRPEPSPAEPPPHDQRAPATEDSD